MKAFDQKVELSWREGRITGQQGSRAIIGFFSISPKAARSGVLQRHPEFVRPWLTAIQASKHGGSPRDLFFRITSAQSQAFRFDMLVYLIDRIEPGFHQPAVRKNHHGGCKVRRVFWIKDRDLAFVDRKHAVRILL